MNHVLLIGFMGAGKSTVGALVADELGVPLIDLDRLIEQREGRTIREIFDADGESAFRALESAALTSLVDAERSVVACGGGIVLADENRAIMAGLGMVVYLIVTAGETIARVGPDPARPLLQRGALSASQLLASRESLYAATADVCIDTVGSTPEQVAARVIEAVKARGPR